MNNTVCGRCSVSKITQFRRCIFSKNIYIFRHLKLEIVLAIPALNDEKYNLNNSAAGAVYLRLRVSVQARAQEFLKGGGRILDCLNLYLALSEWEMQVGGGGAGLGASPWDFVYF